MKKNKKTLTGISELGEFGLIDCLTRNFNNKNKKTVMGVGDDAAIIDTGDPYTIITKDIFSEGVHFDITYAPLKHLGYKVVTANLSDIYAMNGVATHIFTGIGVSSRYSLEAMQEIYSGIELACERYGLDLGGGDTIASKSGLFISVTALGHVSPDKVVYRSGAKEHDLICVSGNLGGAYAGLLILEREKQVFKANPDMQPDLKNYDYVLERQLKPEARKDIIEILGNIKVKPSSMIDISDGLASEIMHICKNSDCGASIYEEKFPLDKMTANVAHEFKIDPATFVLNGGEDYELLFTINQKDYEKIKDHQEISVIGHITDKSEGAKLITVSGNVVELKAQGWDAFKTKKNK